MQNWRDQRLWNVSHKQRKPFGHFWSQQPRMRNSVCSFRDIRTGSQGTRTCFKCGLGNISVNHQYVCHARNINCFKCGKLGHVAKVCFTRNSGQNVLPSKTSETKKTRTKSSAKRRRDKARIQAYKNRKQVLSILPFSNLANEELIQTTPDQRQCQMKAMHIRNSKLQQDIKMLSGTCKKLKMMNSELQSKNVLLNSKYNATEKKLIAQEDRNDENTSLKKRCLELQKTISDNQRASQEELEYLESKICNQKADIRELYNLLDQKEKEIDGLKKQIQTRTTEVTPSYSRNTSQETCTFAEAVADINKQVKDCLKRCEQIQIYPPQPNRHRRSRRGRYH